MKLVAGYLLAVLPMTLLVVAALMPPRIWQVIALLLGPMSTVLAVLGVWPFTLLGWLAILGVPYLYLLVPPTLPWRRPWARVAIPVTGLLVCLMFAAVSRAGVVIVIYLGLPIVASLGALCDYAIDRRPRGAELRH